MAEPTFGGNSRRAGAIEAAGLKRHWVCWSWLSMVDDGGFEMICLSFKFETHVGVLKAGAFHASCGLLSKLCHRIPDQTVFLVKLVGFGGHMTKVIGCSCFFTLLQFPTCDLERGRD